MPCHPRAATRQLTANATKAIPETTAGLALRVPRASSRPPTAVPSAWRALRARTRYWLRLRLAASAQPIQVPRQEATGRPTAPAWLASRTNHNHVFRVVRAATRRSRVHRRASCARQASSIPSRVAIRRVRCAARANMGPTRVLRLAISVRIVLLAPTAIHQERQAPPPVVSVPPENTLKIEQLSLWQPAKNAQQTRIQAWGRPPVRRAP